MIACALGIPAQSVSVILRVATAKLDKLAQNCPERSLRSAEGAPPWSRHWQYRSLGFRAGVQPPQTSSTCLRAGLSSLARRALKSSAARVPVQSRGSSSVARPGSRKGNRRQEVRART